MASFDDHCAIDRKHLGREFPEVHRWLDAYFKTDGFLHRRHRHHREGVEIVRKLWGVEGAKAAILHILVDAGHLPSKEDWSRGYVLDSAGKPDIMDEFGLRNSQIKRRPSGLVEEVVAWSPVRTCPKCGKRGEHRLIDPEKGQFLCPNCGTETVDAGAGGA